MESSGWIRLHRKIMDNQLWLSEPFTRAQAWIDLLLLANHKAGHMRKRGVLVEIKRGQVGYSEESLADRWHWSRGKVRRFLKELKPVQQIDRKPVQQNPKLSSLISITNYHLYQGSGTTDGTTDSTTDGHQTVQGTKKNKKNKNIYTSDFLTFWAAYPRKIGKPTAFKAWQKNNLPSLENILQAIEQQKQTDQWKDERFIPHPSTWLNQGRWEDEIKVKGDSW